MNLNRKENSVNSGDQNKSSLIINTIRGNRVDIGDDQIFKHHFNETETANLEMLYPYLDRFEAERIRIPHIIHKDLIKGILTLNRLPFGNFPTISEYFGEKSQDHIGPIQSIARMRGVCDECNIQEMARNYPDNNDFDHFYNLLLKQN